MSDLDQNSNHEGDTSNKPNWDLLPDKPVDFFQLEEEYDRKQLKRNYNRLIKRFKPERHPEEFQKIRAAYERLEQILRYGEHYRSEAHQAWEAVTENDTDIISSPDNSNQYHKDAPTDSLDTGVTETPENPFDQSEPSSPFAKLAGKLDTEEVDADELYSELSIKENKEATDYYLLALVSDFATETKHLAFLEHLLQGLRKYPRDSGLAAVTYRYLNDQVPDSSLPKVVVACSKSISHDGYYQLTEGIWNRLLKLVPFARFRLLLDECEQNLDPNEHHVSGRVVFYLHMLQLALWKEDSDWIQSKFDFIEEHFGEIPPHAESDFEVLTMTREYLSVRKQFTANGPECKKLDRLMEDFFCADPVESDREFLEHQFSLSSDYQPLIKELPINEERGQQEFFALWNWIAHNIGGRLITHEEREVDYNFWGHRMNGWLSYLLSRNPLFMQWWDLQATLIGLTKVVTTILASSLVFFFLFMIVFAIDPAMKDNPIQALMFVAAAIATVAFAARFYMNWWPKYVEEKYWQPHCERMLLKCYRKVWQPACLGFLRQSQLDYFEYRGLMGQMPQLNTSPNATWINNFIYQDIGMAVFALAQKFRE